jgi:hypothetical protein
MAPDPEIIMPRSVLKLSAIVAASLVGAAPGHAAEAEAANFVIMDEISVPIVDASRIDGVLRVSLTLQMRDAQGAAALTRRMPALRASALAATIEFARLHASPFSAVDVARLSAALTPALARVDQGIAKVLIVKISAMPG